MIYALDSNIISYLLKDNPAVYTQLFKAIDAGCRCIIPSIAYYEIKRGLLAVNATTKMVGFDKLCRDFGVGSMDIHVWNEAARLYAIHSKSGELLEDADFFMAAFCIVNGYTLITNNTGHFKRINELKYVNWTT